MTPELIGQRVPVLDKGVVELLDRKSVRQHLAAIPVRLQHRRGRQVVRRRGDDCIGPVEGSVQKRLKDPSQRLLAHDVAVVGDDHLSAVAAHQVGHHGDRVRMVKVHYVRGFAPNARDESRRDRRRGEGCPRAHPRHRNSFNRLLDRLCARVRHEDLEIDEIPELVAEVLQVRLDPSHVGRVELADVQDPQFSGIAHENSSLLAATQS